MLASTLFTLAGFVSFSTAGYVLKDDYNSKSFFSMFDFFTGDDPTHGYVNYVDESMALDKGLIGQKDGATYIGVDYTNVASGRGRNSVRLSSKKAYTHGLIVLDLQHMPGGQCGAWPAFWTLGPDWPNGGEIDIIEGVNSQAANDMTLHTDSGCTINDTGNFSGKLTTPNCDVNAPGQYLNAGCQIASHDTATYGTGFNTNGGGVYATEWTSDAISIWFFARNSIPADLSGDDPDPSGWGKPTAKFEGGCDIDQHFENHNLIFDVTFCGDWAGNVWGQDSVCSAKASSCQAFVENNPGEFEDAFWQINSLKVYQSNGHRGSNKIMAIESADGNAVASSQAVGSQVPIVTETITSSTLIQVESNTTPPSASTPIVTETVTLSGIQAESGTAPPDAPTPTPTSTPAPTTLATSVQKPRYKTAGAFRWNQSGRSSPRQLADAKEGRSEHGSHLLRHQHKAHA